MDTAIAEKSYSNPEVLVSTEWVANNLNNPNVRIIESNEDQLLFHSGHIEGAVEVDWVKDLNDPLSRDYINRPQFEELMSKIGATPETTLVFYGDKNNWWACYSFWIFQLYGHTNAKIMDGGRIKWEKEGRPLTRDTKNYPATQYKAQERDDTKFRAFKSEVLEHIKDHGQLVDVRSPEEFTGARLHMDNYPNEGALRGGHIPGAKSVPWARAIREDGSFKAQQELRDIYQIEQSLTPDKPTIAYCRIGERSSHTWFVLKYLLGFSDVKNYDGSWTEWGNSVGVPIEK